MLYAYRNALCDIDLILNELSDELRNKVPLKLRNLIHDQKAKNYVSQIKTDVPLEDQILNPETKAILAVLHLHYWCENEEEKEKLREQFRKNEIEYKEKAKLEEAEKQANTNKIISQNVVVSQSGSINIEKDKEMVYNNSDINSLTVYEESFIKRLFNKVLNFFRRR